VAVADLLASKDASVRRLGAEVLRDRSGPACLLKLLPLVTDPDATVSRTALHAAAEYGDFEDAEHLIRRFARIPTAAYGEYWRALAGIARRSNKVNEIAKRLLVETSHIGRHAPETLSMLYRLPCAASEAALRNALESKDAVACEQAARAFLKWQETPSRETLAALDGAVASAPPDSFLHKLLSKA